MIKLYSDTKTANHISHLYSQTIRLPKATDYSYTPTGQHILIHHEILFGFELVSHTYKYKTHHDDETDKIIKTDIQTINKKSVIVYLKDSEIQQMYDDPKKFWEDYIEGSKTVINNE